MVLRPQLFRKVTIIGVGLIGGSIGMAIKKNKLAREVVGLSQHQASLEAALKVRAIDHAYHDVKKAVNNADLVILATPVSIISGMLAIIGPHLRRNCIVTDVGSCKAMIIDAAQEHLPANIFFVGSHPLAGSEKKGVQYARASLFENTTCIMTPVKETNRSASERVKRLWTKIGAKVKILTPEEHDKILSYVSHLPHLLVYALMATVPKETLRYAAQGLKDTTRIAGSSPQLWNDICMGNAKNIVTNIDELVRNLSIMRKAISSQDQNALIEQFKKAKAKRDEIY